MTELLTNRRWVVASFRESGDPQDSDLELDTTTVSELLAGQFLVEVKVMSVDPYLRSFIKSMAYGRPLKLRSVMHCAAVGLVIDSQHRDFHVGEVVKGMFGMQEYCVSTGYGVEKVPKDWKFSHALGVLGMPGVTAYCGFLNICMPKPGETVFVSTAAGAVGSIVGQLAHMTGCKVFGSVGSEAKKQFIMEELKFDGVVEYKGKSVSELSLEIKDLLVSNGCTGIDCYFDNAGGNTTDAVLENLNRFGRLSICGQISVYNMEDRSKAQGTPHFFQLLNKQASARGFLVSDFTELERKLALTRLAEFMKRGDIIAKETIVEGIESARDAWFSLYKGQNIGKLVVKLRD